MRYNKLTSLMFNMWQHAQEVNEPQQTVCLLGPPGIGKTSSGRTLADLMTENRRAKDPKAGKAFCRELDLSSMLPEDLNGLPFRQEVDNIDPEEAAKQFITKFAAHEWLHELCAPDAYGVLVLDDLPAAAPMMQVAARQISLERRVHDHRLSPGVFIIVTGNRREDKSSASTLPAHFRNSVMMLDVHLDVDEWAKWYGRNENYDPVIPAFLRFKMDRLSMLPKDADKERGSFATPRTWAKLGAQFAVAEKTETLFDVAWGLVGKGPATEFCAFVKIRQNLVDPEKVFDNPQRALKNPEKDLGTPDKLVAMATALGEIAAQRSKHGKGQQKVEAPLKLLRAVAWCTSGSREYCGAAVSTFIANEGSLPDMVKTARANRSDPVIGGLLTFLKSALMGGN